MGTFIGKDKNKTVPQNLEDYAKTWPPIVKFARDLGVKIAIENCPMIFSYDEWPGGNNLASTPAIWRKMWEIIPDDNFGLSLNPSHLILQMIDYERVIREFSDKIFHVHAKDLHIDRDMKTAPSKAKRNWSSVVSIFRAICSSRLFTNRSSAHSVPYHFSPTKKIPGCFAKQPGIWM